MGCKQRGAGREHHSLIGKTAIKVNGKILLQTTCEVYTNGLQWVVFFSSSLCNVQRATKSDACIELTGCLLFVLRLSMVVFSWYTRGDFSQIQSRVWNLCLASLILTVSYLENSARNVLCTNFDMSSVVTSLVLTGFTHCYFTVNKRVVLMNILF